MSAFVIKRLLLLSLARPQGSEAEGRKRARTRAPHATITTQERRPRRFPVLPGH